MVNIFASLLRSLGTQPNRPRAAPPQWPCLRALRLELLLVTFILLLFSTAAAACPVITSANPRVGSEGPAPKEVSLEFTGKIYPGTSTVNVTDADGNMVSTGKPYGKADDDKFIATKVADLKPGKYKVKWDVLCDCGTMNPGDYKFTVE